MQTRKIIWDFRGALAPPAVASRLTPWVTKKTAAAGSPTLASVSGGSFDLAMDAQSEVQNLSLDHGDILSLDITTLLRIEFLMKVSSASLAAAVSGAFGLRTARNDNLDSPTNHISFKFDGSNAIVCESDDNGNYDLDDKASGISIGTSYKRFVIELAQGHLTQSPPALSLGRQADVRFFISNSHGALQRVAQTVQFNMAAFTSNLQPYVQIQKTTGTAVGTISTLEIVAEFQLPA